MKKSVNPIIDFAKILTTSTSAISVFREIEDSYLKLDIPHYSKT